MSYAEKVLRTRMRKVMVLQALITAAVAAALLGYGQGGVEILAAVYGGAIACINTLLMARGVERSGGSTTANPGQGGSALYLGILQRFALTLAAFALGMGWLQLPALPLLGAFAATQLGYLGASTKAVT